MHLRYPRVWGFLGLCCLPLAARAEFVNQVDNVLLVCAILFLGVPLGILLIYLLIRFSTRQNRTE